MDGLVILEKDGCEYMFQDGVKRCICEASYNDTLINEYIDDDGNVVQEVVSELVMRGRVRTTPYSSPVREQLSKVTYLPHIIVEPKKRGRPRKEKRNTREPTAYNRFISEVMASVKAKHPDMNNKERLKECALLWKQAKSGLC